MAPTDPSYSDVSSRSETCFLNGEPLSSSPLQTSRALHFADGIFETILCEDGRMPALSYHLDRAQRSAARLSINLDAHSLETQLINATREISGRAKVKALISRSQGRASYPAFDSPADILVFISELMPRDYTESGVALELCDEPLILNPKLAGMKLINRSHYIFSSVQSEISEPLFVDGQGKLVETMHHNILFVDGESLVTPELSLCGVEGVARTILIKHLAPEIGLAIAEGQISVGECANFNDAFICNAIDGPVPVSRIGACKYQVSEAQRKLKDAWQGFVAQARGH